MPSRRIWVASVLLGLLLAGSLYLVSRPLVQAYSHHTTLAALRHRQAELDARHIELQTRWRQLHEAALRDRRLSCSHERLEETGQVGAALWQTIEEQWKVLDEMEPYLGPKSWIEQILGW
jgi:hypothetical protein